MPTAIPCQAISRPAAPTSMITISQTLTMRMIRALSRASASWPDSADSRKKGRMKTPVVIALNQVSDALVIIDLVDDEQHHRVLEQIVVERAEQLGDEQRQEPARAEQVDGAVIMAGATPGTAADAWPVARSIGILCRSRPAGRVARRHRSAPREAAQAPAMRRR